ncbi:class I SAM-dependent methyltransferase [Candidatus Pyrohabitans sp.]
MNFSDIAEEYERHATVQSSAGERLLSLLRISGDEDVLDLGCGTGALTRRIRNLTAGRVVGVDPSAAMIDRAVERSRGLSIIYEIKGAEELDYEECFDVIFCNSAFQWFRDPERAVGNCFTALRSGGRLGVQAPAKRVYSPNFIEAVERVKQDERTAGIFDHFRNPWFFLETAEEYARLFRRAGFEVLLSKIETTTTEHTPEEAFRIFSSGAAAGYLNPAYYGIELSEAYISAFKEVVRRSFEEQADKRGVVRLKFYRIFLVGVKA